MLALNTSVGGKAAPGDVRRGGRAAAPRVLVIPLVSWLWLGGGVVGLGAVIAALPQPKRREVMRRLVEAPATVGD